MNKKNLNILHWANLQGLSEDDKKEGLFKRLKNFEDKNEKAEGKIKEATDFVDQPLSFEAKKLLITEN